MDREEGFPPHVIGFMKRKREKEKSDQREATHGSAFGDESGRAHRNP
ncbi:MAG: hypothetical protein JO141_32600 [Bradyrhizobium sp.]|nr:hypothetical protein [Bradyrhizobium sp.]